MKKENHYDDLDEGNYMLLHRTGLGSRAEMENMR